jgi:cell division protein FtsB
MIRVVSLVLSVVLLALVWRLSAGPSGWSDVRELARSVHAQQRENARLIARNEALAAEVVDLKQGEAALEERARTELGMIRPGEVFFRVVEAPSAANKAAR